MLQALHFRLHGLAGALGQACGSEAQCFRGVGRGRAGGGFWFRFPEKTHVGLRALGCNIMLHLATLKKFLEKQTRSFLPLFFIAFCNNGPWGAFWVQFKKPFVFQGLFLKSAPGMILG
jgi:hypothetical protein